MMIPFAVAWLVIDLGIGILVGKCIRFGMGETNG